MSQPAADALAATDPVALLDEAERAFHAGDRDLPSALIAAAAEAAASRPDASRLLGRAAWLAALVSLDDGDRDAFERNAAAAALSFEEAGEPEQAAALVAARAELEGRADQLAAVREGGEAALGRAVVDDARRLVAAADRRRHVDGAAIALDEVRADAGDPEWWEVVERDRRRLPDLLAAGRGADGAPSRLEHLVRAFGLDQIERDVALLLWALAVEPALARACRRLAGDPDAALPTVDVLCRVGFPSSAWSAVLDRLAPDAPLARHELVVTTAPAGRPRAAPGAQFVELDGDVVAFVQGSPRLDRRYRTRLALRGPDDAARADSPPWPSLIEELAGLLAGASTVFLSGAAATANALALARSAATRLARPLLEVSLDGLSDGDAAPLVRAALRDGRLHDAVPCFFASAPLAPDAARALDAALAYAAWPVIVVGHAGSPLPRGAGRVSLPVEAPPPAERAT